MSIDNSQSYQKPPSALAIETRAFTCAWSECPTVFGTPESYRLNTKRKAGILRAPVKEEEDGKAASG